MPQNTFKNAIGLSITDSALVAVEFSGATKAGPEVANYAYLSLKPGVVEDGCIILNEKLFIDSVNQLLSSGKKGAFISKNIILSFPEGKTFSHRFKINRSDIDDESTLLKKAKDYVPIDLREAIVDYRVIESKITSSEVEIDFVAAQRNIVQSLIDVFHKMGLNVVFVDVYKNSLIRYCENRFQQNEGSFIMIHVGEQLITLMVAGEKYNHHVLTSNVAGNQLVDQVKKKLNLSTADAKKALYDSGSIDQITSIIQPFLKEWLSKLSYLVQVSRQNGLEQPKTLYLIGPYSRLSSFSQLIQSTFPQVKIVFDVKYIDIDHQQSVYYPVAIGLALRSLFVHQPEDEINLLPTDKKQIIFDNWLTPIVKRSFVAWLVTAIVLMSFSGFALIKAYINYTISEKEVEISLERAESPYLMRVAKETQQKTLLNSQINTLLESVMPPKQIVEKINAYNHDMVGLISASYLVNSDQSIVLRLRAKINSRADTEAFVSELESDPFFTEVVSPLSNLTGKGERFVSIDLKLDADKFRELANSEGEPVSKKTIDPNTDSPNDN